MTEAFYLSKERRSNNPEEITVMPTKWKAVWSGQEAKYSKDLTHNRTDNSDRRKGQAAEDTLFFYFYFLITTAVSVCVSVFPCCPAVSDCL